ncbi:Dihydrolipoyllysine-residue succinyltransferase [Ascochyta lentis]
MQQVDMTALMHFRKLYKEIVLKQFGVQLGYMGAFTRAATVASLEVPEVNVSMNTEDAYITYRDCVDISVAVSTPRGLVTPVLRGCESKDIIAMERDIAGFAKKARDGKLTMDDICGGNFTISNPGIFGSLFGTPVINYPQSAVFNMNSIRDEPVVINGQVVIRPIMYITITYDHRLIDGREAVHFLSVVKSHIEDPARMLLASTCEWGGSV